MNGSRVDLPDFPAEIPRHPSEASQGMWNRVYTRASTSHRRPENTALPPGIPVQDVPEAIA
jgi:hypothetical protein